MHDLQVSERKTVLTRVFNQSCTPADAIVLQSRSARDLEDDHAFWNLIESCFPLEARDSRSTTLNCMAHPDIGCVTARMGQSTLGLITFAQLFDPNVLFVGYIAVAPEQRHHRLGQRLLTEAMISARESLRQQNRLFHGIVCEVERLENGLDVDERKEREARIRFFKKAGGKILTDSFLMPEHEGYEPKNMALVFIPDPECKSGLTPSVSNIVQAIYVQHYLGHKGIQQSAATNFPERVL